MSTISQDSPAAKARVPLAPPRPSKDAATSSRAAQGKPSLPDCPIYSGEAFPSREAMA